MGKAVVGRLLATLAVWLFVTVNQAVAECPQEAGRLVSVQGLVEVQHAGQPGWHAVQLGEILCPGDSVRVEERGRAAVRLANETVLRLDQRSAVTFPTPEKAATSWLEILKGAVYLISRAPRESQVKTPIVTAALRGTEFLVRANPAETLITVYEGEVLASNTAGSLTLTSGQTGIAKAGAAPMRWTVVKPRDAVQWTLYYPPVIDVRAKAYRAGPAASTLQAALARYRQNDLPAAFASLDTVPAKLRDEHYYTLRAQLLLLVGRVDEARSAIKDALSRHPTNATALALQSIIAVVQNDKTQALQLAEQAVKREPQSPTPYIALSYAQQADFAIDKALASAQEAVRLNPENALAWARVAELQLSKGDLDHALDAAQQAVAHDPELARTQSVLGFAYLTRIDVDKAKTAFDQAIRLDQADPLARLGLGLAKIRKGYLQEGREEIEIATGLDPSNSLIRSYLGKAYYEEKRNKLSADQLAIAKELDPKDPTPWFYDAIRKQTENQPVEALRDLEQSIELNDNRAVYRSQLLLDQDRAAREASLARIYDNLGFEQLAQVEATKSLSLDPANYSAHRFLSDSYANRPRYEIARVSELLQAQLLQPININPVQPSLNETNLNIITGTSFAQAAFNEFTPLFERNRPQLITSGIIGNNDTLADEVVLSGIEGPLSYSLGQFHYETDGFHENNDLKHNIYDVFTQILFSPELNMQAEFRHQETESGDLRLRFDPEDFLSNRRQKIRRNTERIGFHYRISPNDDIIASVIHADSRDRISDREITIDPTEESDLDLETTRKELTLVDTEAQSYELQYIRQSKGYNFIVGVGHFDQNRTDRKSTDQTIILLSEPPELIDREVTSSSTDIDTQHTNAYAYATVNFTNDMGWTIGLSRDSFNSPIVKKNKINPKIGFNWHILPSTMLRAAWFRTLKRPFTANQTVEPTQVSGFNQFYDDIDGTETERYGFAFDHRFSSTVFGGIEVSWRNLIIPILSVNENQHKTLFEDQNEQLHRAYLYWTPTASLTLSVEYLIEDIEKMLREGSSKETINTHLIPIKISYYQPKGFLARFGATYVDQNVSTSNAIGDDQFWILDASFGYRLPKHWGIAQVGIKNLLDEKFRYFDVNFNTGEPLIPLFRPERIIFAQFTLSF